MKYKPSRDIPLAVAELNDLSPSKIVNWILNHRNEERTPESVTMWLKEHPDIYEQLKKEIMGGLPTVKQAVDQSIFDNDSFEELPSIKEWKLEMNARDLAPLYVSARINTLKQLCQGKFPTHKIDLVAEGKWEYKHPDRFSLKDAMEIIQTLKEKKLDTTQYKGAAKDFLISKGEVVGKKIAVGRSRSYGKYAKLYVPKETVAKMLQWIKSQNFEAFVCDLFMLTNGTRINATLDALLKAEIEPETNIRREGLRILGDHAEITVYDKGRRSKYPIGHPWDKRVNPELLNAILTLANGRTEGKIFRNLDEMKIAVLNKRAIQLFAPETLKDYPDLAPNHFWRHLFYQYILRQTEWNYAIAGALGGAKPQSVEESYGQPPDETVKQWADKFSVDITLEVPLEVKA
jgi:hypothetical protein